MNKRRKNNYIILGLCAVLVLMGIGYAAFSSRLNITGTSNITSNWDVRITNIESELNGATDLEAPTYDNTNGMYASFHTGLSKPGDYALYTITIENRGDIDARIEQINTYYEENEYVTFTLSGLNKGDVIRGSETKELQVKVEFNSEVTSIPGDIDIDLDVSIDVAQDSDNPLPADEYYVTYDYTTNGGESSNAVNDYVAENTDVNLSYTASKAGYEFMGWNTDKDAVTGLDSYTMPANNTTLYAIFRLIDTTPPVIDNISTTSTTNSITVVTTASDDMGEITKYEYSIDNGNYVEGTNTYTFTNLTQNTNHTIKVRVTNTEGLTTESEERQVQTSVLNEPTFSEVETNNGKTVTITYPEGTGLTYEYQKDNGNWITATQTQQVEFTESGILVARVSDGINEDTSTYTVEIASAGSDLVELAGVVTSGDGLYVDGYEDYVYTYRGSSPNNYVTFNGETWRIISANTSDNTIKIVRAAILENRQFDSVDGRYQGDNGYCNHSERGCNIWGSNNTLYNGNFELISQLAREINGTLYTLPSEEADLNKYLNETYYSTIGFTSQNMIIDNTYKSGVLKLQDGQTTSTDINQISNALWEGKVALIDATEYVRASTNSACTGAYEYWDRLNDLCYDSGRNNWLYLNSQTFWTMTPYSSTRSDFVWNVNNGMFYDNISGAGGMTGVRPVVTLSPEVKITDGDGSSGNPYVLSL